MFWGDPDGAEAILHLRADALSEDERLDDDLSRRPGWPFVRRTTKLATVASAEMVPIALGFDGTLRPLC